MTTASRLGLHINQDIATHTGTHAMTPPQGSTVTIETAGTCETIVAPHGSGGLMRRLMGAFLIAWLVGWAIGWITAATMLASDKEADRGFLVPWLATWSLGGLFAFWMLYILYRPSLPERFILQMPTLRHDSGRPPFTLSFDYRTQLDTWMKPFQRPVLTDFTPEEIQSLRLREFASGNRLTIDQGAHRHELGAGLSEIEREWLYQVLAQKYHLAQSPR